MGATFSFASLEKEGVEESVVTEALLKAEYKEIDLEVYMMSRKALIL